MKKQVTVLAEIGVIYLAVSILLDFFLHGYQALLWPVLGLAFAVFGSMIVSTLWEQTSRTAEVRKQRVSAGEDELMRLEHICKAAIDEGDVAAGLLLSQRLRALGFASAAYHLNESETMIRTMAEQEPSLLQRRVRDQQVLHALVTNSSIIRKGDSLTVQDYLSRIESWTN
jgi:hypothetical protein